MAYLWQISVVQFEELSLISGTILSREARGKKLHYNLFHIPSSYFKKPLAKHPVKIHFGSEQFDLVTDQYGGFSLECKYQASGDIKVIAGNEELEIPQTYPMIFANSSFPLVVISDIDDTLIVSYTASNWNRIRTILFTSPQMRRAVSFTGDILNAIRERQGRIHYVSKSESNLFRLITSVIQKHKLPEGNLFLTPYLRYNQLLHSKKGMNYKLHSIQRIIDNSPDKRFILMGDDTQQDMSVYASIAKLYPHRIFKIYIRRTRKQLLGEKKKQLDKLRDSGLPFAYFADQDPVEQELQLIEKTLA
jgi:phosphatidate phosphatase APP1